MHLCECLWFTVGLHIETKDPQFINSRPVVLEAGTSLEDLLLDALVGHDYDINNARQPIFIQSFSENSLRYIAGRNASLPLIMLLDVLSVVTDQRLQQLAEFAYGIGPSKQLIVRTNLRNQVNSNDLNTFCGIMKQPQNVSPKT